MCALGQSPVSSVHTPARTEKHTHNYQVTYLFVHELF